MLQNIVVAFLNFNFLLFFILFFPLSLYLFSSIHVSFFLSSLSFFLLHTRILPLHSSPHTYASSSLYLPLHFYSSTSALSLSLSQRSVDNKSQRESAFKSTFMHSASSAPPPLILPLLLLKWVRFAVFFFLFLFYHSDLIRFKTVIFYFLFYFFILL